LTVSVKQVCYEFLKMALDKGSKQKYLNWGGMDWGDEFNNGYDDIDYASQQDESIPDKIVDSGFDLMDIANPADTGSRAKFMTFAQNATVFLRKRFF